MNTSVLRLPFKNENVSMFILSPNSTSQSIEKLLADLTPEILYDVFRGAYEFDCRLKPHLPKFKFGKSSEIVPVRY